MSEGGRIDKRERQIMMKCTKIKTQIMQGCQSGSLTPQQYLEILLEVQKKNAGLAMYFRQAGNQKFMKQCITRNKILKGEIEELK